MGNFERATTCEAFDFTQGFFFADRLGAGCTSSIEIESRFSYCDVPLLYLDISWTACLSGYPYMRRKDTSEFGTYVHIAIS